MHDTDATAGSAEQQAVADSATATPRIGLRPHPTLPWLLLPDGISAQVLGEAALVKLPNTREWFRGVVSQRGNLLPVFDLGDWAGVGRSTGEGRKAPVIIAIGIGADAFALLSQREPAVLRIQQEVDRPDADSIAPEPMKDYLGQATRIAPGSADGAYAHEFDVRRWLGDIAHHITRAA